MSDKLRDNVACDGHTMAVKDRGKALRDAAPEIRKILKPMKLELANWRRLAGQWHISWRDKRIATALREACDKIEELESAILTAQWDFEELAMQAEAHKNDLSDTWVRAYAADAAGRLFRVIEGKA